MTSVGIIANPASGRDIRRLVAQGSIFSNNEKVNIAEAMGVEKVYFMPERFGIGLRAVDELKLSLETETLAFRMEESSADSELAAKLMREIGVKAIVTLGGDGTARAVARGCGEVPLLALSTGTNNVFPVMLEGTAAGLAVGAVAAGWCERQNAACRQKRILVSLADGRDELALVDAAVSTDLFIGSRAIWNPDRLRHLMLARAGLHHIGLSSIGGAVRPQGLAANEGLFLTLGEGGERYLAPVAPGLICAVQVRECRSLTVGEQVSVELSRCTIALDGERELEITVPQIVSFRLDDAGPWVIDAARALEQAGRNGAFDAGAVQRALS